MPRVSLCSCEIVILLLQGYRREDLCKAERIESKILLGAQCSVQCVLNALTIGLIPLVRPDCLVWFVVLYV